MTDATDYGTNYPPKDLLTGEALREQLADNYENLIKRRDELLAAALRIPPIDDETVAQRVSDFIKQITAAIKTADACRITEKEPFLTASRGVDGFFKAIADPLDKAKRGIEGALTRYLRDKEAAERQRREAELLRARLEQERQHREAAEAAAKIRDEKTLAAAIAADKAADAARADAEKAEKAATAKPADLSRTRGEYGAVSSLRTEWTFSDLDRQTLDLEALRHHLPTDALERALRSFIRAGGREIRGANIFETTTAVVR